MNEHVLESVPTLIASLHARVEADTDAKFSYDEAVELTRFVATAVAPLWEAAGLDDVPQVVWETSAAVFRQVWFHHGEWEIWDADRNDFLPLTMDNLHKHFGMYYLDRSYQAHEKYWKLLPRPTTVEDRRALGERRERDRSEALQLVALALRPLDEALDARIAAEEAAAAEMEFAKKANTEWPPPAPQPYGVSPRGAEFWVRDAVRWLGAPEAEVTRQSGDGGLDVVTSGWGIQVKHYAASVPVEELRATMGAAMALGLRPMLWTSGSLTESGRQFAEMALVPVVHYDVETAKITGVNELAATVLREGLRKDSSSSGSQTGNTR